ncbi:MAG TPA: radical SAM protein [Thermodesulfobacteriota bacterium]|nr:radical SAM protein [Thermodesulfobacteriota bacterium]
MSSVGYSNRELCFEQGPIRPPSEAKSLLVRVTRNCPWNKCLFCRTYKGTTFSLRSLAEIKQDMETIKKIYDEIKAISWKLGLKGEVTEEVVHYLYHNPEEYSSSFLNVAMWLYYGEGSVFLQDGNNLMVKTSDLVDILTLLKNTFPEITRVTSYARAKTIATKKTVEELQALRTAGLSRIHIGLESGSDNVLEFIRKGVTAAEHIDAGQKVKEAGISLSEYVIPGLGGKKLSQEHALETARVLNEINPDFIRLRTLRVVAGAGLDEKKASGEFEPVNDEEIVREIRLMVEHLEGIDSFFVSDHILNLLEEVEGKLPEDKEKMLAVMDRFLALSFEEKCNFRLGRRSSIYRTLADLKNQGLYQQVDKALKQIMAPDGDGLQEVIDDLTKRFV